MDEKLGLALLSLPVFLWIFAWKGLALWRAVKYEQRNWFIFLLFSFIFINVFGLLDIIYLFGFATKKMTIAEVKAFIQKTFKNISSRKK